MNPEQQRIAIAEACGWKNADHPDVMKFKQGWTTPEQWCMNPKGVLRLNHDRPDYLNDLNAMHEAEEILDAGQCAEYARQLMKHHPTYCVTVLDNRFAPTEEIAYQTYQLLHATAAQRAEAFLRTIGKWEESK